MVADESGGRGTVSREKTVPSLQGIEACGKSAQREFADLTEHLANIALEFHSIDPFRLIESTAAKIKKGSASKNRFVVNKLPLGKRRFQEKLNKQLEDIEHTAVNLRVCQAQILKLKNKCESYLNSSERQSKELAVAEDYCMSWLGDIHEDETLEKAIRNRCDELRAAKTATERNTIRLESLITNCEQALVGLNSLVQTSLPAWKDHITSFKEQQM